jgi:phosphoribosylanthranilate isomerase
VFHQRDRRQLGVQIKVCCIASRYEAELAIAAGATAIGLVSQMPSGPGVIPETTIAEVAESVPDSVATFLLTSLTLASAIAAQHRRCKTKVVQLCDRLPIAQYAPLRALLPGTELVQVIHVLDAHALSEALELSPYVDALLLDSGNPNLAVKQLGGTGRQHDWQVSARIADAAAIPTWLAGGLRADNVAEAISRVKPWGADVCSGVRTQGKLDPDKLAAFVTAARSVG